MKLKSIIYVGFLLENADECDRWKAMMASERLAILRSYGIEDVVDFYIKDDRGGRMEISIVNPRLDKALFGEIGRAHLAIDGVALSIHEGHDGKPAEREDKPAVSDTAAAVGQRCFKPDTGKEPVLAKHDGPVAGPDAGIKKVSTIEELGYTDCELGMAVDPPAGEDLPADLAMPRAKVAKKGAKRAKRR